MRSRNARPLYLQYLWVVPLIIVVLAGLSIAKDGMPGTVKMALGMAACLVVGAVIGWWRGKLVHIEVHPETHAITSVTPIFAVVLIVVLVVARAGLHLVLFPNIRAWLPQVAGGSTPISWRSVSASGGDAGSRCSSGDAGFWPRPRPPRRPDPVSPPRRTTGEPFAKLCILQYG